jgi:hypothetical protein
VERRRGFAAAGDAVSLKAFQDTLGAFVCTPRPRYEPASPALTASEQETLRAIAGGAGFRLTRAIQRSWCVARAAKAARMTFSVLPAQRRLAILDAWIDAGGGAPAFAEQEDEALFDFIADRLAHPSAELDVCRIEQAALRARTAAGDHRPLDLDDIDLEAASIQRAPGAALVRVSGRRPRGGEPLFEPCAERPAPNGDVAFLFAPGLAGYFRLAEANEEELWRALDTPVTVPTLEALGHSRLTLASMTAIGALDAEPGDQTDAARP